MSKQKSHTGFRNGKLFCFHCGQSQELQLPMDARLAAEWMKGFDKVHRSCPATWVKPVPNPDLDYSTTAIKKNTDWWLENGERGISSETMFFYFTGQSVGKYLGHPSDPDDFRRCYELLKAVPQWKSDLDSLRIGGEVWNKLVDNWDKLTEMLEEQIRTGKPNNMYEFMKSLGC